MPDTGLIAWTTAVKNIECLFYWIRYRSVEILSRQALAFTTLCTNKIAV